MRDATQTLEKEKLIVRRIEQNDLVSLFRFLERNKTRLSAWSSWLGCIQTEHDCEAFLQLLDDHRKLGIAESWGLWNGSELVGTAYIFDSEAKNRRASIVVMTDELIARKGLGYLLAVYAIDSCLNICGVHRLESRCLASDVAANGFTNALGFQKEGELRESVWINDKPQDEIQYSLLVADWNSSSTPLH